MVICKKCNRETENEIICDVCKVFVSREASTKASNEESIQVLDYFNKNYVERIKKKEDELENYSHRIRHHSVTYPKHSFMRFYWPAFILMFVLFFVLLTLLIAVDVNSILSFLAFPITLIGWAFIAKRRMENANARIFEVEDNERKEQKKLRQKSDEVMEDLRKIRSNMQHINDFLPERAINTKAMRYMLSQLKADPTSTFEDVLNSYLFISK